MHAAINEFVASFVLDHSDRFDFLTTTDFGHRSTGSKLCTVNCTSVTCLASRISGHFEQLN
jgi:hypothetical protein